MSDISVIIPTYNRAGLIGETLDAVLSQTRPPDEVIVVDDGSQDDTQSVLASYGSRLRCLRIPNGGELAARNWGLQAASGRLVAFCDSDDLWTTEFLSTMSAQWRTTPELMACYADFRIMQGDVLSHGSKFADAPDAFWSDLQVTGPDTGVFKKDISERLLSFQPFFPSCLMVSRAAFLAVGGWDEGVSRIVGCDFATTLRVAAQSSLGIVRRPLVRIRKHLNNFSGDTEKMNLGDARVLEHVLQTRPELAYLENAIRNSVATRRRAALDSAFSRRDAKAVQDIYQLLPPGGLAARERVKHAIATLPLPFAKLAVGMMSRSSSAT